jgi:hypothetical protein
LIVPHDCQDTVRELLTGMLSGEAFPFSRLDAVQQPVDTVRELLTGTPSGEAFPFSRLDAVQQPVDTNPVLQFVKLKRMKFPPDTSSSTRPILKELMPTVQQADLYRKAEKAGGRIFSTEEALSTLSTRSSLKELMPTLKDAEAYRKTQQEMRILPTTAEANWYANLVHLDLGMRILRVVPPSGTNDVANQVAAYTQPLSPNTLVVVGNVDDLLPVVSKYYDNMRTALFADCLLKQVVYILKNCPHVINLGIIRPQMSERRPSARGRISNLRLDLGANNSNQLVTILTHWVEAFSYLRMENRCEIVGTDDHAPTRNIPEMAQLKILDFRFGRKSTQTYDALLLIQLLQKESSPKLEHLVLRLCGRLIFPKPLFDALKLMQNKKVTLALEDDLEWIEAHSMTNLGKSLHKLNVDVMGGFTQTNRNGDRIITYLNQQQTSGREVRSVPVSESDPWLDLLVV